MRFKPKLLVILFTLIFLVSSVCQDLKKFDRPSVYQMQEKMFQLINLEREKHNLNPLVLNIGLKQIAIQHCKKMIKEGKLEHTFFNYPTLDLRLRINKINFLKTGENIAFSESYHVDQIFNEFINSPGHRANLLNKKFTHCGIGIVKFDNNYYITQIFILNIGKLPPDFKKKISTMLISHFKNNYNKRVYHFLGGENYAKKHSLYKAAPDQMKFFKQEIPTNLGIFYTYNIISNNTEDIKKMIIQKTNRLRHIYSFSIGTNFVSNKNYPDGVYSISLIFFQNQNSSLSYNEKIDLLHSSINTLRKNFNLPKFNLIPGRLAKRLAKESFSAISSKEPILSTRKYYIISYSTTDLTQLNAELKNLIYNQTDISNKIKIGIFEPIKLGIHSNRVYVTVMIKKLN